MNEFIKRNLWYDISKVSKEIERCLRKKYGRGIISEAWLEASSNERGLIVKAITEEVRKRLVSSKLVIAMAKDIIDEEGKIRTTTNVFKYVSREVYGGRVREMLGDIREVLDKENG